MKKKKARKAKKKSGNAPVVVSHTEHHTSLGTPIIGHIVTPYVQFDVPTNMAADVAGAVSQLMLDEYYLARIRSKTDENV